VRKGKKLAAEPPRLCHHVINQLISSNHSLTLLDVTTIFQQSYAFCLTVYFFISFPSMKTELKGGIIVSSNILLGDWLKTSFRELMQNQENYDGEVEHIVSGLEDFRQEWIRNLNEKHDLKALDAPDQLGAAASYWMINVQSYCEERFDDSPDASFLLHCATETIRDLTT
jgi:hypothetical protein